MKKVLLWIGSLMAALFMVIMLLGIMALRGLTDNQVRVESQTVLEVDVAGLLPDYDRGSISSLLSGDRLTVTSLVEGIDRAAADERIIAILLQSDLINTSWGDLRELRHSLSRFREAGKPIYCHVQITADKGYYLASIASQLWLTHSTSGGIFLRGIGFERAYLKNLAAACGIKFDVVHAGKYKGAFENLSRDNMSAPVRRNLGMLLDDISQTYLADISSTRGVETELLTGLLRQRQSLFINGAEALNLNLVDGLKSRHELESWLEETCSDSPRLDMADYLDKPRFLRKQEQIAVLHLEGIITDGGVLENPGESTISSRVFLPLLKELREEEQVLAVVLRINSPGGSASISEEIWQSARELASVKPLLVSMGGVAASGGYYIAAAGDYILAQPTTITGSIGVVGMLTDASQLLAWGKVNYEQLSTSTYHNFGHPAFGMSRHQRELLEGMMGAVYTEFKERVMQSRSLNAEQVEEIAQGQVWSGERALDLGLVDALGSLSDAVTLAAERAGLETATMNVVHYPRQKGIMELLAEFDLAGILLPLTARELLALLETDEVDLIQELLQTRLIWEVE